MKNQSELLTVITLPMRRNVHWSCASVCLSPHDHTTARIRM